MKISVRVDEAEDIFFKSIVYFWVSLSMLMAFLISALYYAYNMLEIVESTLK